MNADKLFHKAKANIARFAFKGEHVPIEIRQMRVDRCKGCKRYFDEENIECLKCGCVLEVKWNLKEFRNPLALRNEIAHCPMGKWDDIDIANYYRFIDGKKLLNHDQENV